MIRRWLSRCIAVIEELGHFMVNFWKMRRILNGVLTRVLLSSPFTTVRMETEAQVHTQTRRKMVVGLGNPGMDGTRHNVGRVVLDSLAVRLGASERWRGDRQLSSELVVCELEGERLILLKPKLLMNVNGAAVAKAVSKFGVRPEDVLLVHDELDKPLGKIAVKLGGSARGHNGVRSCVDCLNTDVMRRLRVGIGRPSAKTTVDRHVLGRFSPDERKVLDAVLVQSVDLLLSLLCPSIQQSPGGAEGEKEQKQQDKLTREQLEERRGTAAAET